MVAKHLSVQQQALVDQDKKKKRMTLNSTWCFQNSTILNCSDFVISVDDNFSLTRICHSIIAMICFTAGWYFSGAILDYLNSKPLGQQSLMDIPQRFLFYMHRLAICVWLFFIMVTNHTIDPGHLVAVFYMWPAFCCTSILFTVIGIHPVLQMIIVENPSLELPFSDMTAFWIFCNILWIPHILISTLSWLNGCYPPGYYLIRKMDPWKFGKTVVFSNVRSAIMLILAVLFWSIRIKLYFQHKSLGIGSSQLLSTKVVVLITIVGIANSAVIYLVRTPKIIGSLQVAVVTVIIFPAMVIFTNDKIRTKYMAQNKAIKKVIDGCLESMKIYCKVKKKIQISPQEVEIPYSRLP